MRLLVTLGVIVGGVALGRWVGQREGLVQGRALGTEEERKRISGRFGTYVPPSPHAPDRFKQPSMDDGDLLTRAARMYGLGES